jgi:hypothetical protein
VDFSLLENYNLKYFINKSIQWKTWKAFHKYFQFNLNDQILKDNISSKWNFCKCQHFNSFVVTCKCLVDISSDKEKLQNTENINNIKFRDDSNIWSYVWFRFCVRSDALCNNHFTDYHEHHSIFWLQWLKPLDVAVNLIWNYNLNN